MKRKQQKSDDMWIMVLGQGAWDEKSVTTLIKKILENDVESWMECCQIPYFYMFLWRTWIEVMFRARTKYFKKFYNSIKYSLWVLRVSEGGKKKANPKAFEMLSAFFCDCRLLPLLFSTFLFLVTIPYNSLNHQITLEHSFWWLFV